MANDLTIYDQGRHFQLLVWPLHYGCVRIAHGLFFLLNGFCIKDILNHLDVELITCFLYMHANDTNEIDNCHFCAKSKPNVTKSLSILESSYQRLHRCGHGLSDFSLLSSSSLPFFHNITKSFF